MAWFRIGGGGISTALKNAMNAVLNKKMGTATEHAPETWPDEVNLMGMLQEKTIVSWPVSSFSDGADDVPTKSIVVTIPPTISGVSSVSETQTGRNLVDNSAAAWEGGNINTSGENATGAGYVRTIGYFDIGGGMNYEISGIAAPSQASDFRLFFYDETKTFISYKNYGSTPRETPANARYMRIRNVVGADMSALQIEYGSTAHSYEPYQTPTVYTASLGRTIYGGQVDIVNGTGTDNCARIKFSELNWTYYTSGTNPIFYAGNIPNMKTYARTEMPNIAIDGYTTRTAHSRSYLSTNMANMANMECSAIENAQTITFRNNSYTSVSDMLEDMGNEYIVYEVATPTDFTFDGQEINTRLGYNAFWSEQGDTEVTYRSSGTITPVVPTLISKTITANGTYSAEDDNADGYDEVTVNVPTAPSGMFVMDFTNISSPFTLNGVSYGATGAVFDSTSDYIDLPFFHAGMEIEIDVASISLGQNANRWFFSSYRNQGFLYRNSNVWSFYNGSWYDTNISDSGYFDNSTVKIVVDSNNYWHIYKDDVLIFEPAGACAISEPAIGSKDGSCINNATITGIRIKEVT